MFNQRVACRTHTQSHAHTHTHKHTPNQSVICEEKREIAENLETIEEGKAKQSDDPGR